MASQPHTVGLKDQAVDSISPHEKAIFAEFQAYVRSICETAYEQSARHLHTAVRQFTDTVQELHRKVGSDVQAAIDNHQRAADHSAEAAKQTREQLDADVAARLERWNTAVNAALERFVEENTLSALEKQQRTNERRLRLLIVLNAASLLAVILDLCIRR